MGTEIERSPKAARTLLCCLPPASSCLQHLQRWVHLSRFLSSPVLFTWCEMGFVCGNLSQVPSVGHADASLVLNPPTSSTWKIPRILPALYLDGIYFGPFAFPLCHHGLGPSPCCSNCRNKSLRAFCGVFLGDVIPCVTSRQRTTLIYISELLLSILSLSMSQCSTLRHSDSF